MEATTDDEQRVGDDADGPLNTLDANNARSLPAPGRQTSIEPWWRGPTDVVSSWFCPLRVWSLAPPLAKKVFLFFTNELSLHHRTAGARRRVYSTLDGERKRGLRCRGSSFTVHDLSSDTRTSDTSTDQRTVKSSMALGRDSVGTAASTLCYHLHHLTFVHLPPGHNAIPLSGVT